MGNVGEGTAMNQGRRAPGGLNQIRPDGILQQDGHCPRRVDIPGGDHFPLPGPADDNAGQPPGEIIRSFGKAQDGHDLGSRGDIETAFPGKSIRDPAEREGDLPKGPIVHVEDTRPTDPPGVQAGPVFPIDVIVDHRRQQIVRGRYGVEIPGEMQVDVVRRLDGRLAAAGPAAFHAKDGTQAGFTEANDRPFTDP